MRKVLVVQAGPAHNNVFKQLMLLDYVARISGGRDLARLEPKNWDLVVIDCAGQEMGGVELAKRLRLDGWEQPIIYFSDHKSTAELCRCYLAGVDYYLHAPISLEELAARLEAIWRRPPRPGSQSYYLGELQVDLLQRKVFSQTGSEIHLRPREFEILRILLQRKGRVVTREQISDMIETNKEPVLEAIDVHISNLRRKLSAYGADKFILTHHSRGYYINF